MTPTRRGAGPAQRVLLGIVRAALGRRDAMAAFDGTAQAFLASLAPLIAFPLVGAVLMALHGGGLMALRLFLFALCVVLAPPVLSHEVARAFRQGEAWLRYATAYNWCQWAVQAVAMLLLAAAGVAVTAGVSRPVASMGWVAAIALYQLWLNWFLARHGLGLGRGRAALLVLAVNIGTGLLAMGPLWLGHAA